MGVEYVVTSLLVSQIFFVTLYQRSLDSLVLPTCSSVTLKLQGPAGKPDVDSIIHGVSKRDLQGVERWIVCTPLSVNVFVTLATQ
jgi:hypothetical protein